MNEKTVWIIVRSVAGVIILITFLLMFVINPGELGHIVETNNLWEAVHPYHWLWDTLGLIGLIFFALYITGLAGKTIYWITGPKEGEGSSGYIHAVAAVSLLLTLLFLI